MMSTHLTLLLMHNLLLGDVVIHAFPISLLLLLLLSHLSLESTRSTSKLLLLIKSSSRLVESLGGTNRALRTTHHSTGTTYTRLLASLSHHTSLHHLHLLNHGRVHHCRIKGGGRNGLTVASTSGHLLRHRRHVTLHVLEVLHHHLGGEAVVGAGGHLLLVLRTLLVLEVGVAIVVVAIVVATVAEAIAVVVESFAAGLSFLDLNLGEVSG